MSWGIVRCTAGEVLTEEVGRARLRGQSSTTSKICSLMPCISVFKSFKVLVKAPTTELNGTESFEIRRRLFSRWVDLLRWLRVERSLLEQAVRQQERSHFLFF